MISQPSVNSSVYSSNGITFICEQINSITCARKSQQQAPRMSAENALELARMFEQTPNEEFPDAVTYYGTVYDQEAIDRIGSASRRNS